PDGKVLAVVAEFLGIEDLSQWRIKGKLVPTKGDGWRLEARMTADVVQACVATLEPVPARIDEELVRGFMPEDAYSATLEEDLDPDAEDAPDTFGAAIDLGAVALEALALSLDPYPRTPDASADPLRTAPPGVEPLTDEALRPFAKLAALKEKLESKDG
ncbi:MAG: DUF177 domain-containing protein, partial [Pseudomonadota bacterium]